MIRTLRSLIPILIGLGLAAAVWFALEPPLTRFILSNLSELSAKHTPYRMEVQNFHIRFLNPGIEVEGIVLHPQGSQDSLPKVTIGNLGLKFDFLQLLGGRFSIAMILIDDVRTKITIENFEEGPSAQPMPSKKAKAGFDLPFKSIDLFRQLNQIPVSRLKLTRWNVEIDVKPLGMTVDIKNFWALASAKRDRLSVDLRLPELTLNWKGLNERMSLGAAAELTPRVLEVSEISLFSQAFQLKSSAKIEEWEKAFQDLSGSISLETAVDLDQLNPQLSAAPASFARINPKGSFTLTSAVEFSKKRVLRGSGVLKTSAVRIYDYEVGSVSTAFDLSENQIRFPKTEISHSSGEANLSQTFLNFGFSPFQLSIKSLVSADSVDLSQLLLSLKVPVPLEVFINTQLKCEGSLAPRLQLGCQGYAETEELEVRTGQNFSDILVRPPDAHIDGEFTVTAEDVRYKGKIQLDEATGSSQGVISYTDGFSIDFASNQPVNLTKIGHLAGFRIEGMSMLSGHTEGTSQAAQFWLDFHGNNLFFENYALGESSGKIHYDAGILSFQNINGKLGSDSSYSAKMDIDLNKKRMQLDAQLNQFQAFDLAKSIQRYIPIPLDVTGIGQAQIWVEGPLTPNLLSYRVNSQINRGTVFGESFESLEFRISSNSGRMQADTVRMKKGKSLITLQGQAFPSGEVDFFVRGDKLSLEDSESVSQLGTNINGDLDFSLDITGQIRSPEFNVKAKLQNLIIEDQEFAESSFAGRFDAAAAEGRANLLGNRLTVDFRFPFQTDSPFYMRAKAKEWDYSTFFALIGNATLINEYNTSLSGSLDLSSEKNGLATADGFIRFDQFLLQRDLLLLTQVRPLEITAKSGKFDIKNFRLIGPQASLELSGPESSVDQLNLRLEAKLPLRLLQIAFPFLDELGGSVNLNTRIGGKLIQPEIMGTADLNNGFLKIKNLPHAIEKLNAKVEFSKSKILIPRVDGIFAGGQISGLGNIEILGLKQWPLNIDLRAEGVNLNIPDRMQTSGNLDLKFSGSWFPFLLSGEYRVAKGFIDKEFGDETQAITLKASNYLPKVLLKSASDPLNLDLNIQMDKPLRVKNSLADANVTGQVQVRGSPSSPQIAGTIQFDKNSKVGYRDRSFDLSAGSIKFSDSIDLNPDLYFAGRSRVNEYEVNLLVQGNAKNPSIRLSSLPPLPEKEIISLLALGMTSSSMEKSLQTKETESNTNYRIGSALLTNNPVTKKLQQSLGVDLDVSSSYDDKKNVAVRIFTMSKKLSRKMKASASRQQKEQSSTEVKLEYSLTPSLSAVAAWENRDPLDNRTATESQRQGESIIGLDLDFRREFK